MRFGLLLGMATFGIMVGTQALAAGGRDYEVTYYNERQLWTEVGTFYKPCGTGAARLTGRRTRYFTKSQTTCPGGGRYPPSSTISCEFTQAGCTDALVGTILTTHPKSHHVKHQKKAHPSRS